MHYPKFTDLSKKLWQDSLPTFEKVTETPLVLGLITGLSSKEFQRFTLQDIYYLERSFQPVMKILSQKAGLASHKQLFSDFITATDIELVQLKKQVHLDCPEATIEPSEICVNYGEHLLKTAENHAYSIGVAACLPCFWFFPALGLHIKNKVGNLALHPQSGWIKVYAEELYDNAYTMAELANKIITNEEEQQALEVYTTSAMFELEFFKDALE